jgi:hypothetical protein
MSDGVKIVKTFRFVKVGERVTRMLAGRVPMEMMVSSVDEELIYCGAWTFNRDFGYEVDLDLGWGVEVNGEIMTGSFLVSPSELFAEIGI